ncbi:uncharacterized protein EDB93DRAFT_1162772 [Suillus bovinus]|uniref:uncharacterized protein n=1 Tax=Suillus bovinus TaxID=48563 RepID=UPI001B86FD22|nr:uncharacterized protein EDB93DRAFT_1162772 [Suillus bovinus]KAG2139839.1 hypothetical protein EDB93DRAFT_1162772 [Suillus bovinus]
MMLSTSLAQIFLLILVIPALGSTVPASIVPNSPGSLNLPLNLPLSIAPILSTTQPIRDPNHFAALQHHAWWLRKPIYQT